MECQGYFQVLLAMAVFWNKDWIENVFIFFIVVWLSCFGDSLLGAEAAIRGALRNFTKFTGKHLWILWNF